MSHHEKGMNKIQHKVIHNPIPTSLYCKQRHVSNINIIHIRIISLKTIEHACFTILSKYNIQASN